MTCRERIYAVLEGRQPDRVPLHHISVSSRIASELLGREAYVGGGINQWREAAALWNGPDAHAEFVERTFRDAVDIAEILNHDIVRTGYWRDKRKPAERIDEYTFRYVSDNGSDWEIRRLDTRSELYNRVDGSPRRELRFEDIEQQVERAEESLADYRPTAETFPDITRMLAGIGRDREIICRAAWTAIPVDEPAWLEAAVLQPDLVARYVAVDAERSVRNMEVLAPLGGRLFFGGGDFASDHGPMYSPRVFEEIILPSLQRVSETAHRLGGCHFFGTDGNVWPVADMLYRRSGIDGHYEVDRKAGMDILKIHERYPDLTIIGNISSYTLHVGAPQDVEAETIACIAEAKETGKVIAGCSNIIISETPMENVETMLKTLEKHR